MEYMSVPAIVVICYLIAELFKIMFKRKKQLYKGIPTFVGIIGGIIGFVLYFINPEIIGNAPNAIVGSAIGIVSGLASTGSNQIIKQILKEKK